MRGIDIAIYAVMGAWLVSGLGLAAVIFWKSGLPDYETYDGPAIAWGETAGTVALCVMAAPFWYLLAFQEWRRRSRPKVRP